MPKYIECEKAYELARTNDYYSDFHKSMADLTSLKELLDDTLAADVVEVRHGEWSEPIGYNVKCSRCRKYSQEMSNYCPNCGAIMGGRGINNVV
ncbi:MAG: hypothetical protein UHD64_02465 [Bacteroidales bacterium]|nr:hypothetical protein [Bacteroidales bacterium]